MTVNVDFWQLVVLLVSFLGFVFGAGKVLLVQTDRRLDQRFDALEAVRAESARSWENKFRDLMEQHRSEIDQYKSDSRGWQDMEREFLKFRASLPLEYVRREDYVRNQTIIEAKLDALALKIENLQLKGFREC